MIGRNAAVAAVAALAVFGAGEARADCALPMERGNTAATIYFNVDSADLTAAEKLRLMALAERAKAAHAVTICVVGQADKQGAAAYNADLSARRAEAVRRMLVLYGAPEWAVETSARGEAFGPALDEVLWQAKRDRYVEVVLAD